MPAGSLRCHSIAEELLAGELPAAERAVLAARLQARPAIYRVETSRDDAVVLQDLFSGERTELHDPRLIRVLEEGLCLLGRVCHQGGYDMFQPVGPALPAVLIPPAMDHLAGVGLELSADGVAKAPHLLGRLWLWLEEHQMRRDGSELQNTDGHPVVMQTASFTVEDPASVDPTSPAGARPPHRRSSSIPCPRSSAS